MTGMGQHHHAIATSSSPEARRSGIRPRSGFNHEEAVRSFKRASESIRRRRCHTGMSWALGPNYNLDVDDERRSRRTRRSPRPCRCQKRPGSRTCIHRRDGHQVSHRGSADRAELARKHSDAIACETVSGRSDAATSRREPHEPAGMEALDGRSAGRAHGRNRGRARVSWRET